MSVFTKDKIWELLRDTDQKKKLVVTPLLDKEQIGDSSIDVRLGTEFIFIKKATLRNFDFAKATELTSHMGRYQEKVRVDFHNSMVLHPYQLVLGSTLEYVKLPSDIAAYVIGKSSIGRTGLIIATATAVAPGFKGCITLELLNTGELPIVLYPGIKIAQLIFHKTDGEATYHGRFECPTGPTLPRLDKDTDLEFWAPNPS